MKMSMVRISSVVWLLIVATASPLHAQLDSLGNKDSLMAGLTENIIEQTTLTNDSPLPDLLPSPRQARIEIRSRLLQGLQLSKGFGKGIYFGSPIKSYQRMKFTENRHLTGGIVLEKDAGEQRFNDFISGGVVVSDIGPLSKAIIGDYFVEGGQGVALWREYDYSKGAEVILPVFRRGSGLTPHLSSDENAFLRGAAIEGHSGSGSMLIFYSQRFRSGSLDSNDRVTSFHTSGYFRTDAEREKRDNLTEKIAGTRIQFHDSDRSTVGITWYQSTFSRTLLFDEGRRFSGDRYSVGAVDYMISLPSVRMFGEWARSVGIIGGLSGLLFAPSKGIDVVLAVRHYPYRFMNLHGLGFGERSSNETGFYIGMDLRPLRHLRISTYIDEFKFPEPDVKTFPAHGNDFLIHIEYLPAYRLHVRLRYQRKVTESRQTIFDEHGFGVPVNGEQRKHVVRFDVEYKTSPQITLRGRIDHTILDRGLPDLHEKGTMLYQDLAYHPGNDFRFNVRITYFNTDSYDVGSYAYENDLQGLFSLPVLYGTGIRWYVFARYSFNDRAEISLKYSDLIRDDVRKVGTGLDELPTNHDDRIGLQLDWSF